MIAINKKLRFVVVLSLLLVSLMASVQVAYAYVSYQLLSITAYSQEQTNWCWATTDQMIIKYLGGSATQTQIVTFVKGSPVNEPATDTESQTGLAHWNVSSTCITYGSVPSFGTVISQIQSNKPIDAGIYWTSGGGHYLLIRGYYEWTEQNKQDVYYIDPYDASYNYMNYDTFKSNSTFNWKDGLYNIHV